jgi:hypothetical protein
MPALPRRDSIPPLPDDHPFLSPGILSLAAMPAAQRNARLLLIEFINSLPKEDLAIFAKTVQPHLTDEEVADLCGVSVRQMYRWDRYQSWKPTLHDYLEFKRRQMDMPEEDAA